MTWGQEESNDLCSKRKRLVFVFSDGAQIKKGYNPKIISLPHPKNNCLCKFVLIGGIVYEVQQTSPRRPSAWFIDQSIKSDGTLFLCTPFDIRFFFLPFVLGIEQKPIPLSDLLPNDVCANYLLLTKLPNLESTLEEICDIDAKHGSGKALVSANPSKVLAWVKRKVEATSHKLLVQSRWGGDGAGAVISTFSLDTESTSSNETDLKAADTSQFHSLAFSICSEYLPPNIAHNFQHIFQNSSMEDERESTRNDLQETQRFYNRIHGPKDHEKPDDAKKTKLPELSLAQKRLAKVNTKGMSSMTSFFAKKVKPNPPSENPP